MLFYFSQEIVVTFISLRLRCLILTVFQLISISVGVQLDIATKGLEKSELNVFEPFKCMTSLKNKIEQRIKDNYFGNAIRQLLKSLPQPKQNKITGELFDFYTNVSCYLEKRYNFTKIIHIQSYVTSFQ